MGDVKSKRTILTRRICLIPRSDFHSFFKVFTQISPFLDTLGWKTLVMKYALGGAEGKSWTNTNLTRKEPPV